MPTDYLQLCHCTSSYGINSVSDLSSELTIGFPPDEKTFHSDDDFQKSFPEIFFNVSFVKNKMFQRFKRTFIYY